MQPREFFPRMPDDVYEMWLSPILAEYGWPFKGPDDATEDTKWFYVLGKIPLREWFGFEWSLHEVDLATMQLSAATRMTIGSLIDECANGRRTIYSGVVGTAQRFKASEDFIRVHGCIPRPIVAVVRRRELEVVDGNHRLAALFHVRPAAGFKVQAWIPRP